MLHNKHQLRSRLLALLSVESRHCGGHVCVIVASGAASLLSRALFSLKLLYEYAVNPQGFAYCSSCLFNCQVYMMSTSRVSDMR